MTKTLSATLLLLLAGTARGDEFVDAVVELRIGVGGGAVAGVFDALPPDPARVLAAVRGAPRGGGLSQGATDTVSLGQTVGGAVGGITVAFVDNVIVNGPGADFTVFENAFLQAGLVTGPPYAEPGTIAVSADGVHWAAFPCALEQAPYHPGCAGVYPVFANRDDPAAPSALVPCTAPVASLVGLDLPPDYRPACSGGDSFDLAAVGLAAARYVRVDAGPRDARLGGLSGFDLDAVAAVHSVEIGGVPDTDGDGLPDTADGCPVVPDAPQPDADGDGVGDACDRCPELASADRRDSDADGIGDPCDNCPRTPNADQRDTDGDGTGDACAAGTTPDTDGDGVPDATDRCPVTADPSQADGDGDGVGDACDDCPLLPDPLQRGGACVTGPAADADRDGAPDTIDPCPTDPTCLPFAPGPFGGGGNKGSADALLTYAEPTAAKTQLAANATAVTVRIAVAATVTPDGVRVRAGGRDVPAEIVPGSTKTLTIPITRRRMPVRLRAVGPRAGRRRLVDVDRLTYERSR